MAGWDKNDLVRLLPGEDGTVLLWRKPTQAELWKWIRTSGEDEARAPRWIEERVRPEDADVLVVAEVRSEAPEGFEGPKELCKILEMDTGAMWWAAPESVAAL